MTYNEELIDKLTDAWRESDNALHTRSNYKKMVEHFFPITLKVLREEGLLRPDYLNHEN